MLVLRARLLSAHQLPARAGHDTPLNLVQLFDPDTEETYKLPVEPQSYEAISNVPALSVVTVQLGMREISSESGGTRSRSYRLRVIKLMAVAEPDVDTPAPAA